MLRQSQRFLKKNAPTILTCVGSVGVVVTAISAAKATPKAVRLLQEAKEEKGEKLTKLEKVKVAGPAYIPTVLFGAATIACVFGANVLNKQQQAALVSAYAMLDKSYKDYKNKVKELYGADADGKVKEEIAKDKYEETEVKPEDNKLLFYDSFSEQFFNATMEDVKDAETEINRIIVCDGGAFVNEFYDLLGIDTIPGGDQLGWSLCALSEMTWEPWLYFDHTKKTADDGKEYYIISMNVEPIMDFEDFY